MTLAVYRAVKPQYKQKLFSIKINNTMKNINPGVDCSLFVDDFLLCYRSKNMHTIERQLQQNLNNIQDWATEMDLNFLSLKPCVCIFVNYEKHMMILYLLWMEHLSQWKRKQNF